MKVTKEIKNNKGISMVSLIVTIVLMIIISSVAINTSYERFEINKYKKMINDLEILEDKVNNYYLKYKGLPILRDTENNLIKYTYSTLEFEKNANDNENYYIIDLKAMEGISLNYGKEGFENPNTSDDVYIINEASHQIYYVKGVEVKGNIYHVVENNNLISDNIPPTKPEIKIISGEKNEEGIYTTDVQVEIIPGKDSLSNVSNTTYSVNGEEFSLTSENNIYSITENGIYEIKVISYDKNENISENTMQIAVKMPVVGEYVEYDIPYIDMYTGYEFTKTNGWRYIGKDDNGNNLIVSTGIPAMLNFYYNTNKGNILDGGANTWWATQEEISAESTPEIYRTYKGYEHDVDDGEPNKYAAYGLRYKFTNVIFNYQETGTSVSTVNTGIYRKVGAYTSGALPADAFKASGVKVMDVHNLTLAELNRARNESEDNGTTPTSNDGAKGLFYLKDLENENKDYLYTSTTDANYWLAYPSWFNRLSLLNVGHEGYFAYNIYIQYTGGIRPVVTLSSNSQLMDTDGDGIWEIKFK